MSPRFLFIPLVLLGLLAMLPYGCRKITFDERLENPLQFSVDTLAFDTVFVQRGSATRIFKIKNPNNFNVKISEIALAGGNHSPYRLNIDGRATNHFPDYEIEANDSFYIFAEVTIDPGNTANPFLVLDSIVFRVGQHMQRVVLQAYGQNVRAYRSAILVQNTTWDNSLPIVITNSLFVPEGVTLTITEGTRIYSHRGSAIFVAGKMVANGTKDNPIVFRGDRLEHRYEREPGQWYGIRFLAGSQENLMEHAIVRNADIGIQADSLPSNPNQWNLVLRKCQVQNMIVACVVGYTSHILMENSLLHSSGQFLFVAELGGKYRLRHNTLENSRTPLSRQTTSALFTNRDYVPEQGPAVVNDLELEITNTIVYGNREEEVMFLGVGQGRIDTTFSHNLFRTQLSFGQSNLINRDPRFADVALADYRLTEESPARGAGLAGILPDDIQNHPRGTPPDIGCYEFTP